MNTRVWVSWGLAVMMFVAATGAMFPFAPPEVHAVLFDADLVFAIVTFAMAWLMPPPSGPSAQLVFAATRVV